MLIVSEYDHMTVPIYLRIHVHMCVCVFVFNTLAAIILKLESLYVVCNLTPFDLFSVELYLN